MFIHNVEWTILPLLHTRKASLQIVPSSMPPLGSGINSRLLSLNHALISPILHHPVLWVAFPPSVPSIHHSHHPSLPYSFIPGLNPSFSANPSHRSLPFLLPDWLHRFPGLFTATLEHIRFLLFSFSVFHFLVFGSVWQIMLTYVSFWAYIKIASRTVSYIVKQHCSRRP